MKTDDLRSEARRLFDIAVKAADPGAAVSRWLDSHPQSGEGRQIVLALGKAAPAMMQAALQSLRADRALVVTNTENNRQVPGAVVMLGEHPVPDAGSVAAGAALLDAVSGLGPQDRVLVLVSGGGSALAVAPRVGVTAQDKAAVNELLLKSGLDINQMNLVRQALSRIKGGGLARAAAPAEVTALILSDVIGDDLRIVASGPTVARVGRNSDAVTVMQAGKIWNRAPKSVKTALTAHDTEPRETVAKNHLIGSNRVSLDAMAAACDGALIVDDALTGDVAEAAEEIVAAMRGSRGHTTLLFGGETTVNITGTGRGGRNQELALRVAMAAQDLPGNWVFLSGGTDGRDGPTDAAGGIVDADTVARMKAGRNDPKVRLANNDSYAALEAAGDLLMTGGTGTNVADVQIFLRR